MNRTFRKSPAETLLAAKVAQGRLTVTPFGRAWRIHGPGFDLLVASLADLHPSDFHEA